MSDTCDPLRLVIASRNSAKSREIGDLLADSRCRGRRRSTIFPTCPKSSKTAIRLPKTRPKRPAETAAPISRMDAGRRQRAAKSTRSGGAPGIFLGPLQRTQRDRRIEQRQAAAGTGRRPRRAAHRPLRLQRGRRRSRREDSLAARSRVPRANLDGSPRDKRIRLRSVLSDSRISPHVRRTESRV